ncbi:hypothetical protein EV44_g0032 [Erysiphe necator]|uniref:Secreted effector protein n=1 Tax=Uncinula necator TaxID=52586 RepID=A0A0B1PB77_UNCNE|nr:hypothetical protein EV44_g0032 [Erysiphe necator]
MKFFAIAKATLIVASNILVFGFQQQNGNSKVSKINLQPSNIYVKCGSISYTSEELDKAAAQACPLMTGKGKFLGIRWKTKPTVYQGTLLAKSEQNSLNTNSNDYKTKFLNFDHHPLLQWPLANKFKYLKANCYAIIKWDPTRVKCKVIGAYWKEKNREDVKCEQLTIRDKNSRYAASPIYHPGAPNSVHRPSGKSESVHDTTSIPPFNSNLHSSSAR